ncbi:MAG: D-alanine--D-alanine ligase [Acidobacteria bacterium]|nr:D-alanine--D-alanine ligase [Acidobacteriota bacterium]
MKKNVAVLFGGKSGEHEVSLVSGTTVAEHLHKRTYRVFALGIRKDGSFADPEESRMMLRRDLTDVETVQVVLRSGTKDDLVDLCGRTSDGKEIPFHLFFPVLHGPYGEDGTIQGLLEMTGRPFVGCGVMGSSVGIDKVILKQIFTAAEMPVLPWLSIYREEWAADAPVWLGRILKEIGFPCFVKPARLGSSVGISRVLHKADIENAVVEALHYDYKIVVEQGIPAREIECSVMGNHRVDVSLPGEIVPARDFYDYTAKYISNDSNLIVPAELEDEQVEAIRDMAGRAFLAIGGEGYGRVDFLMDQRDNKIYVNEINTIPGFTPISMFPKLWTLSGMELPELLDRLVELALERQAWKSALKTSYGERS